MRLLMSIAVSAMVFLLAGETLAIAETEDVDVTAAYVKEHPKEFSIVAKNGDDGLIHFRIIRHLSEPSYLVAHFEVRDKDSVVATGDFPGFFVEEKVARYWFAVSPKRLPSARFDLDESGFSSMKGTRLPTVAGSTNYKIRLGDFAPKTSETSGE
jgi:hypothetical protein